MTEGPLDIRGYDFQALPRESIHWIWKGYLARGNMTVLAAPPKAGKSTLLFHLLKHFKDGGEFLGLEVRPSRVLLFTEESPSLMEERKSFLGEDLPLHCVFLQPGLSWSKIMAYSKLKHREGFDLVVLDTVSRFWPVQNEGDAVQVLQAMNPFLSICRQEGFALLVVHHTRKTGGAGGNAMRGSNALLGSADIGLEFNRVTPWDRGTRRRIDSLSRYGSTPDSLIINMTEAGYQLAEEGAGLERTVMFVITTEGSVTAEEMAETQNVSLRSAQRTLAEMVARGILDRTGTGGPRSPYRFTLKASIG